MTRLSDDAVSAGLADLPGWSLTGDGPADGSGRGIEKTFELADFPAAIAFVVRVGFLAEAADHHPDLALSWGKAEVRLSTHSAGGITAKDFELARGIEAL